MQYERSIAAPPPSCTVVNKRATQPAVLAAYVTMLSCPVLRAAKAFAICGNRALNSTRLFKSYAAAAAVTDTRPGGEVQADAAA
jgi:hypothetical protein